MEHAREQKRGEKIKERHAEGKRESVLRQQECRYAKTEQQNKRLGVKVLPGAQNVSTMLSFTFITLFFRPESKPQSKLKNYLERARMFGYRGDREHFEKLEMDLSNEVELIRKRLSYFEIFEAVKGILDSVPSVTNECY